MTYPWTLQKPFQIISGYNGIKNQEEKYRFELKPTLLLVPDTEKPFKKCFIWMEKNSRVWCARGDDTFKSVDLRMWGTPRKGILGLPISFYSPADSGILGFLLFPQNNWEFLSWFGSACEQTSNEQIHSLGGSSFLRRGSVWPAFQRPWLSFILLLLYHTKWQLLQQ